MPLHPQAEKLLAELNALHEPSLSEVTPEQARATVRPSAASEDVAAVDEHTAPGAGFDVPVRVYRASDEPGLPLLVWYHGGGWVRGSVDAADPLCRVLANRLGAVCVSVDYRLAPEHPFPAAVEDCYAATAWAAAHATELGADAGRMAIGGSSAGGNLAAAVALMARDRGGPPIRHQLLVYPIIDDDFERPSYRDNAVGYRLTRENMIWFWDQYVPNSADRRNPYAVPHRAENLAGLPPASVFTAEYDPLRDEGEAYAARLQHAGIPTTVRRVDGQFHGFFGRFDVLDDARTAIDEAVTAVREHTR